MIRLQNFQIPIDISKKPLLLDSTVPSFSICLNEFLHVFFFVLAFCRITNYHWWSTSSSSSDWSQNYRPYLVDLSSYYNSMWLPIYNDLSPDIMNTQTLKWITSHLLNQLIGVKYFRNRSFLNNIRRDCCFMTFSATARLV